MFNYQIANFSIKLFLLLQMVFCSTANADLSNQYKDEMVEVKLISPFKEINTQNPFYVGLEFNLNPEWKIYWRSPGDSGSPPFLDLSASENLKNYKMRWPVPTRINETEDIVTNVYFDRVVFPVRVVVEDTEKPLILNGKLSFQVCETICIPIEANLHLIIKNGYNIDNEYTHIIEKAVSNLPLSPKDTGITNFSLHQISQNNLRLNIDGKIDFPVGKSNIFLEKKEGENIKIDKVVDIKTRSASTVILDIFINNEHANAIINNKDIGVTFSKGDLAVFKKINVTLKTKHSFVIILLISLMGGFILNFMPCVLPVLSLKVSRFISRKNISKELIKYNFLFTSLGIIFSFMVLACISIVLKLLGDTIGWGVQFQQPLFISFMVLLILLFSANLFGLFQFSLPSSIYTKVDKYIKHKEKGIAFFEGTFATLLATPCSAPFLGTAVGYAMSSEVQVILIIFTFLGIGMSLPYLLFYLYPNFIIYLPKPGNWMKKLNFILGMGLAGSAIWLTTVLLTLSSWTHVFLLLLMVSVIIFIFSNKNFWRAFLFSITVLLSSIVISFSDLNNLRSMIAGPNTNKLEWNKFEDKRINNLVNEGNMVFIDITADWCVTCKVNKLLILENKKVINLFNSEKIILMRGDWTKPDEKISSFLFSWNRYGIPLNVVYGPNAKEGILLPELLTLNSIQDSIVKSK